MQTPLFSAKSILTCIEFQVFLTGQAWISHHVFGTSERRDNVICYQDYMAMMKHSPPLFSGTLRSRAPRS